MGCSLKKNKTQPKTIEKVEMYGPTHNIGDNSPIFIFWHLVIPLCSFSFLETSITALRLFNLNEISKSTGGYKTLLGALEKEPQRVLISILIANNIANVTAAALITHVMEEIFAKMHLSQGLGFSLGIAIATGTILIIGEVIPKNIAQSQGQRLFKSTLWLTSVIYFLMYPIVVILFLFQILSPVFSEKKVMEQSKPSPQKKKFNFLSTT